MAGNTLNVDSVLKCPHGATVKIISSNTKVMVDGVQAALATDQFVISGCPFQIPIGTGTKPSPCVTVKWLVTDLRTKVGGDATLSKSSVGLCQTAEQIPQGPVVISTTQVKVSTQ
jgi:hypothetical protein